MNTTVPQQPKSTRGEIGLGIYALSELRAFLAVSGERDDAKHALKWLIAVLNPVAHEPRRPDYSFSDLISLFVVRELVRRGVAPGRVASAERYLRALWEIDRPFTSDKIQTDGVHVFFDDELIPGQIESADERGQQALVEPIRDRLRSVHYHDGIAAYWTPAEGVLIDPRVQFGEPVVAGTRVPTEAVAQAARTMGPDGAARQFGVSLHDAHAAIAFQSKLTSWS